MIRDRTQSMGARLEAAPRLRPSTQPCILRIVVECIAYKQEVLYSKHHHSTSEAEDSPLQQEHSHWKQKHSRLEQERSHWKQEYFSWKQEHSRLQHESSGSEHETLCSKQETWR
jgi:hypothetical protein